MMPSDVLDAQGELLERIRGVPDYERFVNGWANEEVRGSTGVDQAAVNIAPTLGRHVEASYAYSVTHEMSTLIEHAAADLEPLDRFDCTLAPTGCGFVNFDRPLQVIDARGKKMLIHFLIWGPYAVRSSVDGGAMSCTAFWCFNDPYREPDEVHQIYLSQAAADYTTWQIEKFSEVTGRWGAPVGFSVAFQDQRMGPKLVEPSERVKAEILGDGLEPHAGTNVTRYVHALWLLLNQTLVNVAKADVDRAARRRAVRKGLPGKVSVIELRRREPHAPLSDNESGALIEWQHQWISRAHWGWRHCSAEKPGAVPYKGGWGVRVWVRGSVKGNPDGPLIVTDKVYRLSR